MRDPAEPFREPPFGTLARRDAPSFLGKRRSDLTSRREAALVQSTPADAQSMGPDIGLRLHWFLRRILQNWWLVLIVAVMVGSAGHALVGLYVHPTYEAAALVQYPADQAEAADAVRSQAQLLTSAEIVQKVGRSPDLLKALPWLRGVDWSRPDVRLDAATRLAGACQAAPVPHTEVIRVWSSGADPAVAMALSNAFAAALAEQCRALPPSYPVQAASEHRRALEEQLDQLDQSIRKLSAERSGLLAGTDFDVLNARKKELDAEVKRYRDLKAAADAELLAAGAEVRQTDHASDIPATNGTIAPAEGPATRDAESAGPATRAVPTIDSVALDQARRRRSEIAERDDPVLRAALVEQVVASKEYWEELGTGKTEQHRDVFIAKRRMQQAEQSVRDRKAQLAASIESAAQADVRLATADRVAGARSRLKSAQTRDVALDRSLSELELQSRSLDVELHAADVVQQRLEEIERSTARVTQQHDEAWEQLQQFKSASREPPPLDVHVARAAILPQEPVEDTRPLARAGAWSGGLLLGLLAALLLGEGNRRIKRPDELERIMGAPILGTLPHVQDHYDREGAQAIEQIAEEIRAVRTRVLLLERPEQSHGTLCIVSPTKRDGRTSVCVALGVSLARTGRRVLMVDASLRAPGLHRFFKVDPAPGLSDIMEGRSPLESAVFPTDISTLDVLPGGTAAVAPAELLSSPALGAILQGLGRNYDHVIIDSHPLLVSSDTHVLLGQLDGIICVFPGRLRHRDVERAGQILRKARVNLLGLIVNQVDAARTNTGGAERGGAAPRPPRRRRMLLRYLR